MFNLVRLGNFAILNQKGEHASLGSGGSRAGFKNCSPKISVKFGKSLYYLFMVHLIKMFSTWCRCNFFTLEPFCNDFFALTLYHDPIYHFLKLFMLQFNCF